MSDSFAPLPAVAVPSPATARPLLALGVAQVDDWLNGGLRRDGVHECYALGGEDRGAATGFALLIAARAASLQPSIWLRVGGRKAVAAMPFAPGLAEMGLRPDNFLLVQLPDIHALLKASIDAIRHIRAGCAIIELDGRAPPYDLTASRRLALAAERSGTLVLIVRSEAQPGNSAAHSRWQVGSAPSTPLPADAPGNPVFDLRLLRQRGGREGLHLQLEWDREQACFRTPLSGGGSALSSGGTADRRAPRAA